MKQWIRSAVIAGSVVTSMLGAVAHAQTTTQDVKKQAGKTVKAAAKYVSEQKDEFAALMQKKLDDVNAQLEDLERQAARTGHQTSDAVAEKMKALEAQKREAQKKLDELKEDTGSAWKRLKKGVEKAVDDVSDSVSGTKRI